MEQVLVKKEIKTEIMHGNLIEEFKDSLKKCHSKAKEFEPMLENDGVDFINDYCEQLRTKVKLAIESRKEELDKFGDEILEKINKYESERITCADSKELADNQDIVLRNESIIHKMFTFFSEWHNYMSNTDIDENKLKEAKVLLVGLMERAKEVKKANTDIILGGAMCDFQKNTEMIKSNIVGDVLFTQSKVMKRSHQTEVYDKKENSNAHKKQRLLSNRSDLVKKETKYTNGLIATGSVDGTIRIWNFETGQCVNVLKEHTDHVNSVSFNNYALIASCSDDNTIKLWGIDSSKSLRTLTGHTDHVLCVSFDNSGLMASGSGDNTIKVWNVKTGQCLKTLRGHNKPVLCVSFNDEGFIASGSQDKSIKIWNYETGKCVRTLKGHTGDVLCVSLYREGLIASGSSDQTLKLWNFETGECQITLEDHTGSVNSIEYSDYGLATCSSDNEVIIWDLETGFEPMILEGHTDSVNSICFNRHGLLASCSDDKTLKIWNVETGECLRTITGHTGSVNCVSFNNSGLVAGIVHTNLKKKL